MLVCLSQKHFVTLALKDQRRKRIKMLKTVVNRHSNTTAIFSPLIIKLNYHHTNTSSYFWQCEYPSPISQSATIAAVFLFELQIQTKTTSKSIQQIGNQPLEVWMNVRHNIIDYQQILLFVDWDDSIGVDRFFCVQNIKTSRQIENFALNSFSY